MVKYIGLIFLSLFSVDALAATDSYRWLHVTIETPWFIFIFLLPMVLLPAILMAVLYWKFAGKKKEEKAKKKVEENVLAESIEKQD